jgi:hypothetical protein
VLTRQGGSVVLATVVSGRDVVDGNDFLPLVRTTARLRKARLGGWRRREEREGEDDDERSQRTMPMTIMMTLADAKSPAILSYSTRWWSTARRPTRSAASAGGGTVARGRRPTRRSWPAAPSTGSSGRSSPMATSSIRR